jgi:hypothetical protein
MSHVSISQQEFNHLTKVYDHESTAFFHHQDKLAEEFRLTHNDQLPDTQFWHYLEQRHAINPIRFDHYHPMIGRWIEEVPVSTPLPPPVTMTPPPNPGPPQAGSVPEPTSVVLLGVAMVLVAMFLLVFKYIDYREIGD